MRSDGFCICQHTSAYVSIRQHTAHTSTDPKLLRSEGFCIRQHTSANAVASSSSSSFAHLLPSQTCLYVSEATQDAQRLARQDTPSNTKEVEVLVFPGNTLFVHYIHTDTQRQSLIVARSITFASAAALSAATLASASAPPPLPSDFRFFLI